MRVQANRPMTETRTRQKPVSSPPLGLAVLLVGVITLANCGTSRPPEAAAPAEAAVTVPELYDPGAPQYAGSVRESKYLTMRDGVKIAIDVHLPEGLQDGQKLPTILWQTRYWRSMGTRWPFTVFWMMMSTVLKLMYLST